MGIFRPRVAGEDHAAPFRARGRGSRGCGSKIGERATTEDAVVVLPEAPLAPKEDLCRGVVVQLANGAVLGAQTVSSTSTWRNTGKGTAMMA